MFKWLLILRIPKKRTRCISKKLCETDHEIRLGSEGTPAIRAESFNGV